MATDEQKKANMLRLSNLTLYGLTTGVWDYVGESSFAMSEGIGESVLGLMEKEMGLEIAGASVDEVLTEINRLFVDEFGFADDIEILADDSQVVMKVHSCLNRNLTDKLMAAGVEKPFICPIMNAAQAALKRMGTRARIDVAKWEEGKGSIITLTIV